ncbi:CAMK kinase [Metarhizium rileyi]|uniref:mitogen-activated protein kinase n=1 Tax=Metarhizium rileyi (strain RCEF 4871) TaxID=1649241 RepID=A0A166X0Z6_METRR|nr:CAMK kinase [Metarhizium rileyi RCEF 4871]
MPQYREPDPNTLFSLSPKNDKAVEVVTHELNSHLVSLIDDTLCLDVGHLESLSGSSSTLATLGRGNADIFVSGSNISKIQCSFEILDNGIVLFHDESKAWSSQVFGEGATAFEYGRRPRTVVVLPNVVTRIGFGGDRQNLVVFELVWRSANKEIHEVMEIMKKKYPSKRKENPRFSRTIQGDDTVAPTGVCTRVGPQSLAMRWKKFSHIGSGSFGVVSRGVDLDSGRLMAVKTLTRPAHATHEWWMQTLNREVKREVNHLAQLKHPRIVEFIMSQGWGTDKLEIFMGLKDGCLESLIVNGSSHTPYDIAVTVMKHVLQALDFLSVRGMVHRDVKPGNILYQHQTESEPDQVPYSFQLGDFGLSNRQELTKTLAGSPLFMAPEMCKDVFVVGEQTHKADVWSLYATLLWTMDVCGFRSREFRCLDEVRRVIQATTSDKDSSMANVCEMARIEPLERASAAQMLVKCFNGEGLSTQRAQVPPICVLPVTVATQTGGKAPLAADPSGAPPEAGPATPNRPGLRGRDPPGLAAGQFRLDRAMSRPPTRVTRRSPRPVRAERRAQAARRKGNKAAEAADTPSFLVPDAFPFDTAGRDITGP